MREISTLKAPEQASCPNCWKAVYLCVCAQRPILETRLGFLILQHPREAKNPKGSARLLSLALPNSSVHRVGLSWRSLNHALGTQTENPAEWAVLYVGTQKDSKPAHPQLPFEIRDRKGRVLPKASLKGIVLLDGNWKQSKTLWWRNPWLLKLNRVLLNPTISSRYGTLRKQPRVNCLSTIEAGAESLAAVGETDASQALVTYFESFLQVLAHKPSPPPTPASPLA